MDIVVPIVLLVLVIALVAWGASDNGAWFLVMGICGMIVFGCMGWDSYFSEQAETNRHLDSIQGNFGLPDFNDVFLVSAFLPLPIVVLGVIVACVIGFIMLGELFRFITRNF